MNDIERCTDCRFGDPGSTSQWLSPTDMTWQLEQHPRFREPGNEIGLVWVKRCEKHPRTEETE